MSCFTAYFSASNGQQQPATSDPMQDSKVKSADRFYEHTVSTASNIYSGQSSQFSSYSNPDGTGGFLEGMFTTSASTTTSGVVAPADNADMLSTPMNYDVCGQYSFDSSMGHFLAPVTFFPPANQNEGITSHPLVALDTHGVGMTSNTKLHHSHQHSLVQHQQSQPLEQHRGMEETASGESLLPWITTVEV